MDKVKFFKGCLPQVLVGPFLNIMSLIILLLVPELAKTQSRQTFEIQNLVKDIKWSFFKK